MSSVTAHKMPSRSTIAPKPPVAPVVAPHVVPSAPPKQPTVPTTGVKKPRVVKEKPHPSIHWKDCYNNQTFFKVDGSAGTLKITGAATHLSKNKDCVYHGTARVFGKHEDVLTFLRSPQFAAVYTEGGGNLAEIENPWWFLDFNNFHAKKADPEDWVYAEIADLKKRNEAQNQPNLSIPSIEQIYEGLKATRSKKAIDENPAVGLANKISQAQYAGKVLDVSNFDVTKMTGYKTIVRPSSSRSERKCCHSKAIASTNLETLEQFLKVLNLSDDERQTLIDEWKSG